MSPKFTFLAVLLTLYACKASPAERADDPADEWTPLATSIDGGKFAISHVRRSDRKHPTAWVRKESAEPGAEEIASWIGLWRFDCDGRRLQVLSYSMYRLNGSVVQSGDPLESSDIEEGTAAEKVMRHVCPVYSPKSSLKEPTA